jgi:energy-coupling factor transporter transmembrane protein EcfT
MQHYNDEKNKAGAKVLFMIVQMVVLTMVYIIIYTSFVAVGFAIDEYGMSVLMYFPVFAALVIFPILLYKYRQMFNKGKMMGAFIWTMATASLVVVLLYVYVAQITG